MDIVQCHHCSMRVVPMADGVCPACRKDLAAEPVPQPPADLNAWEKYQLSLREPQLATAAASNPVPTPPTVSDPAAVQPAAAAAVARFEAALVGLTPHAFVTPTMILLCIVGFGAAVVRSDSLFPLTGSMLHLGANFGPKTLAGEWWRTVTSVFLHFNPLHLLFNMWALWGVGRLLERLVGNTGFLLLYLTSALTGSLASLAWQPAVVSAGASGAVFGVCGGVAGFLLRRRDTVRGEVLKHLRASVISFIVFNALYGLTAGYVDNAAHFGGLAGGFVLGVVMSQPLDQASRQRRRVRNTCASAAAGLIAAFMSLLPPASVDISVELVRIEREAQLVLGLYRNLLDRSEAGQLTDSEFAILLKEKVINPWRTLRKQTERLRDAPAVNQRFIVTAAAALRLREESFEALAEAAVRSGDESQIDIHLRKWEEANHKAAEAAAIVRPAP